MVARTIIPKRLTGGAVEHIRRNSGLSISTEQRLQALEEGTGGPTVGTFLGGYDQVADTVPAALGGGPLQPASNYVNGDYFLLTVNGTFTTAIPELNGLTGGTGDMIITDAVTWFLFDISSNYLSSQVADTAEGVITFNQRPVGTLAATAANEYIRKSESDTGDANNASALSAHEGQTTIANDVHGSRTYADSAAGAVQTNLNTHIADNTAHGGPFVPEAPSNGILYGRLNGAWWEVPYSFGYIADGSISGAWNTTLKDITGYTDDQGTPDMDPNLNLAAGYIEIPSRGVWNVNAIVTGNQGNDTKEEAMRLWLRVTNSVNAGDVVLDVFDVATDKTSDRAFSFNFSRLFEVGERVSLAVNATASMGTFSFDVVSLEVSKYLAASDLA